MTEGKQYTIAPLDRGEIVRGAACRIHTSLASEVAMSFGTVLCATLPAQRLDVELYTQALRSQVWLLGASNLSLGRRYSGRENIEHGRRNDQQGSGWIASDGVLGTPSNVARTQGGFRAHKRSH